MKQISNTEETSKYPWPENCYVQGGSKGVVLRKEDSYTTAFVEAFPKSPDCFIRGEGATIEEADDKCWEKYQEIVNCPRHEFERRDRKDGYGFCKRCGMGKSKVFEPLTKCVVCKTPTNYSSDKFDNFYCAKHKRMMPHKDRYNGMLSIHKKYLTRKLKKKLKKAFHNMIVSQGIAVNPKVQATRILGSIYYEPTPNKHYVFPPFGKRKLVKKYGKKWLTSPGAATKAAH